MELEGLCIVPKNQVVRCNSWSALSVGIRITRRKEGQKGQQRLEDSQRAETRFDVTQCFGMDPPYGCSLTCFQNMSSLELVQSHNLEIIPGTGEGVSSYTVIRPTEL